MAQLLHLDGRPQTWDELHARLASWSGTRMFTVSGKRRCSACTHGSHFRCLTFAKADDGRFVPCGCECK